MQQSRQRQRDLQQSRQRQRDLQQSRQRDLQLKRQRQRDLQQSRQRQKDLQQSRRRQLKERSTVSQSRAKRLRLYWVLQKTSLRWLITTATVDIPQPIMMHWDSICFSMLSMVTETATAQPTNKYHKGGDRDRNVLVAAFFRDFSLWGSREIDSPFINIMPKRILTAIRS